MTTANLRHKARLTLEDIIEHTPEGELRALFGGSSAVWALLTG